MRLLFSSTLFLVVFAGLVRGQEGAQPSGGIKFSTPDLTDEDYHSPTVPLQYRCAVCQAVAYQLEKALEKEQIKLIGRKRLSEVVYIDVLDKKCNGEWDGYGIKKVNGVNRFTGDGVPYENDFGFTQTGGKWPFRLTNECQNILGEVGEDEIYEAFYDGTPLKKFICLKKTKYCNKKHDEL
ncbi:Marginal zone B- and B1-cell-specific protein [Trichoplax sp. H2]|uniref:DUF3456 domain-containing protein n=1 Tax=Trichoplax adhaerens TaxID=10228 RepID=B3SCF8_TRIAD|nr:hypothetical protein TRIADDRAFT_61956 [Trichoplax adhaerens]EDV19587.1 hypothetical protein TRIADDRAFT_61956 [Trichoplax adhaerens]RDD41626.1 Marginal zone B- and B1-cell-specific protein [Trichoplax sp. H2]|eukprot:XP_002117920.1 hypothetical protein TRIADDRAFT_61956 [Trichoplax adhaerens]